MEEGLDRIREGASQTLLSAGFLPMRAIGGGRREYYCLKRIGIKALLGNKTIAFYWQGSPTKQILLINTLSSLDVNAIEGVLRDINSRFLPSSGLIH